MSLQSTAGLCNLMQCSKIIKIDLSIFVVDVSTYGVQRPVLNRAKVNE